MSESETSRGRGKALERTEFEALRDLPGKKIHADIKFARRKQESPLLVADRLVIQNDLGIELRLDIHYNPEIGSMVFVAIVAGTGPVCRLCLGGSAHAPAGRYHKHALKTSRCPARNLGADVVPRDELQELSLLEAFQEFCTMASIEHVGTFEEVDAADH